MIQTVLFAKRILCNMKENELVVANNVLHCLGFKDMEAQLNSDDLC
jgi:hypothetical protein